MDSVNRRSLERLKDALFYDRPLTLVQRALALAAIDEKLERMYECFCADEKNGCGGEYVCECRDKAHGKGPAVPGPDHPAQP